MTETVADYVDLLRTAEIIVDAWADKFHTDCVPDLEVVGFWLDYSSPEKVLRAIAYAHSRQVPGTYRKRDLIAEVDDYLTSCT